MTANYYVDPFASTIDEPWYADSYGESEDPLENLWNAYKSAGYEAAAVDAGITGGTGSPRDRFGDLGARGYYQAIQPTVDNTAEARADFVNYMKDNNIGVLEYRGDPNAKFNPEQVYINPTLIDMGVSKQELLDLAQEVQPELYAALPPMTGQNTAGGGSFIDAKDGMRFEWGNDASQSVGGYLATVSRVALTAAATAGVGSAIGAATGLGTTASQALAGGIMSAAQGGNFEEALKAAALAGVSAELGEALNSPTSALSKTFREVGIDNAALKQGLVTTGTKLATGSSLEEAVAAGVLSGGIKYIQGKQAVDPEEAQAFSKKIQQPVADFGEQATELRFPSTPDARVDVNNIQLDALPDDPLGNIEASQNIAANSDAFAAKYAPAGAMEEVSVVGSGTATDIAPAVSTAYTANADVAKLDVPMKLSTLDPNEYAKDVNDPIDYANLGTSNVENLEVFGSDYGVPYGQLIEYQGDLYRIGLNGTLTPETNPNIITDVNKAITAAGIEDKEGFVQPPLEYVNVDVTMPEYSLDVNRNILDNIATVDVEEPLFTSKPVVKPTEVKPVEEVKVTAKPEPTEPPLVIPELPIDIAKPLDPVVPKVPETEPEQEQAQQDKEESGGGDSSGSAGQLTPSQTAAQQVLQMAVGAAAPDMRFDVNNDGRITSFDALEIARNYSQYEDLFADTTAEDTIGDTTAQEPVEQPQAPVEQPQAPVEQPQAPVEQPQEPAGEPQPTYDDGYNTGFTDGAGSVQQQYTRTGENEWQDLEGNVYKYESVGSYDSGYDTGYTDGAGSVVQKWTKTGDNEYTDAEGNVFTYEELGSYDSGYGAGYGAGNEAGYTTGYGEGETAGYGTGYGEGYGSGYGTGMGTGKGIGFGQGYGEGNTIGLLAAMGQKDIDKRTFDPFRFKGYKSDLLNPEYTRQLNQQKQNQKPLTLVESLFGDYLK